MCDLFGTWNLKLGISILAGSANPTVAPTHYSPQHGQTSGTKTVSVAVYLLLS